MLDIEWDCYRNFPRIDAVTVPMENNQRKPDRTNYCFGPLDCEFKTKEEKKKKKIEQNGIFMNLNLNFHRSEYSFMIFFNALFILPACVSLGKYSAIREFI